MKMSQGCKVPLDSILLKPPEEFTGEPPAHRCLSLRGAGLQRRGALYFPRDLALQYKDESLCPLSPCSVGNL